MKLRRSFHKLCTTIFSSSTSASRDLERIAAREQKHFSYKTLSKATDKFNANRKLGEGGFGAVYRAYKMFNNGRSLEIMDPTLRPTTEDQVSLCIHIGLLCVQSDPSLRPTMERAEVMLTKRPSNLEKPTKPGNTHFRVYHRSTWPATSSVNVATSAESSSSRSQSTATTTTNTKSASTTSSAARSPGPTLVDRGKCPMEA
ncbi:hypothetical protein V2J09_012746 [Rumex salicifolius]